MPPEDLFQKGKELFLKYKEMIAYLFFGGLTTLVNIVAYWVCANLFGIGTVPATAIAWILSVAFAYVTNKLFVFESKSWAFSVVGKEVLSFVGCRAFSGVLDIFFMWLFVDMLHINDLLIKVLSNIVVIILNYVFSKLLIFRKKPEEASQQDGDEQHLQ